MKAYLETINLSIIKGKRNKRTIKYIMGRSNSTLFTIEPNGQNH